jgi:ribosomal protein L37E
MGMPGRQSVDTVIGLSSPTGSVDAANFALPLDYLWNDLKEASTKGKQECLVSFYCRSCGHTEYARPTWYCRTCGLHVRGTHTLSRPAPGKGES